MVGLFVVMHYKALFGRTRPSRLSPELLPPIEVPGHLSFPSGHATQSALIAWTLAQVMPPAAWQVAAPVAPGPWLADAILLPPGPVFRMAERLGRNREVLGLHYPSDSAAGRLLAAAVFPIFLNSVPTVAPAGGGKEGMGPGEVTYDSLWSRARTEWQQVDTPPGLLQPGSVAPD